MQGEIDALESSAVSRNGRGEDDGGLGREKVRVDKGKTVVGFAHCEAAAQVGAAAGQGPGKRRQAELSVLGRFMLQCWSGNQVLSMSGAHP